MIGAVLLASILWTQTALAVNWDKAPVGCVEDYPRYFKDQKRWTKRVLKHTKDFSQKDFFKAFDIHDALNHKDEKINLIYKAAYDYRLPPAFLYAILMIENTLIDDGVSFDGGNYACGISQLDINEWCRFAQSLSEKDTIKLAWPKDEVTPLNKDSSFCNDSVSAETVAAFMEPALHGMPQDLMNRISLSKVALTPFDNVKGQLTKAQYDAAISFFSHCQDIAAAIPALAYNLREIYDTVVPHELKAHDALISEDLKSDSCPEPFPQTLKTFQASWIFVGAVFNAGDDILPALDKYKPDSWTRVSPDDFVNLISLIPTTGEYFNKTLHDWKILDYYVRAILNWESPFKHPLFDPLDYPTQ